MAIYPNAQLRFYSSDILLNIHSDATYPVLPKACSCVAGYFRLLDKLSTFSFCRNSAILIECKSIQNVVTSAVEAEAHGVFHNAKIDVSI